MNSLEFIKSQVKELPEGCEAVRLDSDGEIRFVGGRSGCYNFRPEITRSDLYEEKGWTREEFEACDISGRVSTVNRDIERGTIDAVLNQRGSRYGKFKDGADIMQELKSVMRSTGGWGNLSPSQREALEMIQHKIGRILNGDPNYDDNWIDISGYSKLVADELNGDLK